MRLSVLSTVAVCLLLAVVSAFGAAPNTVSYQGRLLDPGGNPVADGDYTIVFTVYDAAAAGSVIWTSGAVNVPVADGLFSVNLGEPPMTVLPPNIASDSSRWLGITVGADPEMTPRTKITSAMFALHAGSGGAGDLYVDEIGDTITGMLSITDSISVGTTTFEAPMTFRSYDRWSPTIGNGFGDIRLTDGVRGFSIGMANGGGGAGHVRMWPSGGSQLVTIATPNSGDQLTVDGNVDKVWTGSPFSVNTSESLAPITIRSADNWRWDIGSGLGDFRLSDGFGQGLSIGLASFGGGAGAVSFWSSGGLVEDIHFGSPTFGNIFQMFGLSGQTRFNSPLTYWYNTGTPRALVDATQGSFVAFDSVGNSKGSLWGGPSGSLSLYDDDYTLAASLWGGSTFGGYLTLNRADGNLGLTARGGSALVGQGGIVDIYDGTGSLVPVIEFSGAEVGDAAVVLPIDAVNAYEILNEPGIVTSRMTSSAGLSPSATSQDFTTVTITIPEAGYIVVEGVFYHSISNPGSAFAWAQISETSNRAREVGHYHWTGTLGYAGAGGYTYLTTPVRRVYQKVSPGTHTFYLQGNLYESNSGGVSGSALAPCWLQATYYPTSYGTVQTIVESPGDNPNATAVTLEDPLTGEKTSAYLSDLTYYEQKAREARIAELKARLEREAAELELAKARRESQLTKVDR